MSTLQEKQLYGYCKLLRRDMNVTLTNIMTYVWKSETRNQYFNTQGSPKLLLVVSGRKALFIIL